MTRVLILVIALGSLSACEQYREPKANCFNLVSRGPTSLNCNFEPLGGPGIADEAHD